MLLNDLVSKVLKVNLCEIRTNDALFFEAVILFDDFALLNDLFTTEIGVPLKLAGKKPSKDVLKLTKDFGGIMLDQTLFVKDAGNSQVCAMFWPWQDKEHITLKLFVSEL